jgi:hypothetical protein
MILFIHISFFSLSVGPTGTTQTVFYVKFSLPVNFVVLIRVAYGFGSGSQTPGECIRTLKNYMDPFRSRSGSATLVILLAEVYLILVIFLGKNCPIL